LGKNQDDKNVTLCQPLPPHAEFDIVVDDEVQLLLGKAVVPGEDTVDFVKNELTCRFK
jgi:hypothetical protein